MEKLELTYPNDWICCKKIEDFRKDMMEYLDLDYISDSGLLSIIFSFDHIIAESED